MALTLYKVIFPAKKSNYNQRKENFKQGLANHIAINMVNEGIDNEKFRNSKKVSDTKKSKKRCDHSKCKKFIPASWVKYIQNEIKKDYYWVVIILLTKSKMNNEIHQLKSYFLR